MRKSTIVAVCYLVILAVAVVTGWIISASDLIDFQASNTQRLNSFGAQAHSFHVGSEVRVQRYFCVSAATEFHYYPALVDAAGTVFPLTAGALLALKGCKTMAYGFILPPLPAGTYTLRSTINYENGPLKSDASLTLPAIPLEILP